MSIPVIPVSQGSPAVLGRALEGWRVMLADFPPGLELPRHAHDRATLATVISGEFRKQLVGGGQECRPCTVLAEPAGERHANVFGPRGARVVLLQPLDGQVDPRWAGVLCRPRATVDPGCVELARRIGAELSGPDDLSALALHGLTLELLVATARGAPSRPRSRPPWLGRLEERLRAGFVRPPDMGSLAREVGLHPVHVARVFRSHYGTTVAGYVRRLRVAWAQEQLLRPGATMADVALASGFADQSHFARVFRRLLGVTPGQWRRRNLA
jgi:AraC family transcriptional regulator